MNKENNAAQALVDLTNMHTASTESTEEDFDLHCYEDVDWDDVYNSRSRDRFDEIFEYVFLLEQEIQKLKDKINNL